MSQSYAVKPGHNLTASEKNAFDKLIKLGELKNNQSVGGFNILIGYAALLGGAMAGMLLGLVTGTASGAVAGLLLSGSMQADAAAGPGFGLGLAAGILGGCGWLALRWKRKRTARKLLKEEKVLIVADKTADVLIHARTTIENLPESLRADVQSEMTELAWRLANLDAKYRTLQAMKQGVLTDAQRENLTQAQGELSEAILAVRAQLTELCDKASKAGSLEGGNIDGAIAAAAALAFELKTPDPAAIGGPLLDAYTAAYTNGTQSEKIPLEARR